MLRALQRRAPRLAPPLSATQPGHGGRTMIETTCTTKDCDSLCVPCMRAKVSKKPEPPPHQRRIPDPPQYKRGKTPKSHKKQIKRNSAVRVRLARPIADKQTDESIPHGTERGYTHYRCRCLSCKGAYSVSSKARHKLGHPQKRFDEMRKARLAENRLRPEWEQGTDDEIFELLRLSAIKLEDSVKSNDPKVLRNAADLSNYAFIAYDRTLKGEKK